MDKMLVFTLVAILPALVSCQLSPQLPPASLPSPPNGLPETFPPIIQVTVKEIQDLLIEASKSYIRANWGEEVLQYISTTFVASNNALFAALAQAGVYCRLGQVLDADVCRRVRDTVNGGGNRPPPVGGNAAAGTRIASGISSSPSVTISGNDISSIAEDFPEVTLPEVNFEQLQKLVSRGIKDIVALDELPPLTQSSVAGGEFALSPRWVYCPTGYGIEQGYGGLICRRASDPFAKITPAIFQNIALGNGLTLKK